MARQRAERRIRAGQSLRWALAAPLLVVGTAGLAQTTGSGAGSTGAPASGFGLMPGTTPGSSGAAAAPGGFPALSTPGMPNPLSPPDVRLGQFFGFPFGGSVPNFGSATDPSWQYEISVGVTVRATDNAQQSSREKESDVITSVTPTLRAFGNSARLAGSLAYSPSFTTYANGTSDDRLNHRFNGNLIATLVPERGFLDMRGSANFVPTFGGFTESDTTRAGSGNTAQTSAFTATPYWQQPFGTFANGLVGYTYSFSRTDGDTRSVTPGGTPFFRANESISHTGFAAIRTGEDFARIGAEARVTATTFEGDGAIDGSYRNLFTVETRYAVSLNFALLAEVGYEKADYNGNPGYQVDEPVYGAGFRWDPSPDTTVTARYQRRFGFDAPSVQARMQLGGRTVLTANYSDSVGGLNQRNADLLGQTQVNQFGEVVNAGTGSPNLGGRDGLLAVQNGLFRVRRGEGTLSQFFLRDVVSLSYVYEKREPLSADEDTVQFEQTSNSVGLTWSRSLDDVTVLSATGRVGIVETPERNSEQESYLFRATLSRAFSPTLGGSISYEYTNRETSLASGANSLTPNNNAQNAIIATLRKRF